MGNAQPAPGSDTATVTRQEVTRPSMYKVLLHNDNYTTMEFVVMILQRVFHKSSDEAVQIMMAVHRQEMGVAGIYPAEIAETKINTVHGLAQDNGYPLRCSMEPE